MKYIFISFLLFLAGITFLVGQNLSLSNPSGALSNGDTVYIWGDTASLTIITSHFEVHNNGSSAIDVRVKKKEISIIVGSENFFCWGTCYTPAVFTSLQTLNIAAGGSNENDFSGDYKSSGNIGQSTIMYTFYNDADPNDSVCVNVVYGASPTSIDEISPVADFSNAYPNPAKSIVYFNYSLNPGSYDAELVVSDLLGSEAIRQTILVDGNRISLDVSTLTSGVYFYSLNINGKAHITRKLIIRH